MVLPSTASQLSVNAADIKSNLEQRGSILDQIRQRSMQLDREVKPSNDSLTEPQREAPPEPPTELKSDTPEPEAPIEEAPELAAEPEQLLPADNLKRMRHTIQDLNKKLKEKEKSEVELSTKVKAFETGEIVPEVLKQKENEISRLSFYEKLHNLKGSKSYQETFIKPLEAKRTKLMEIAKDYGLPEDVMSEAVGIKNRAERNGFLSSHFDDVGAMEVKALIEEVQEIQGRAKEAELEPEKMLQRMERENAESQERFKAERFNTVAKEARDYWTSALTDIQRGGNAIGLVLREGNKEWNETVVQPLLSQAAVEYGKVVTLLAEAGLETIPENLGKALASAVARAHDSAIVNVKFNEVVERLKTYEANSRTINNLYRPPIGGGGPQKPDAAPPAAPRDAATAASTLLSKVMR